MRNWITEEEACEIAGYELVAKAEKENCECSILATEGTDLDGWQIFEAVAENETHRVTVIYLVSDEDAKTKELDQIQWQIEGYKVEEI